MMLAGAAWAVYSLEGRGRGEPVAANADSFARSVPLVLVAQAVAWLLNGVHASLAGATLALVSGAVTSGLGYVVWYAALRGLSSTQAGIVQLSVPLLAAIGAVALLGERLDARLVVCGAAILGGIALALAARSDPPGDAKEPAPGLAGKPARG
jgi:drug/metabolite transporter (DMT)-like permease